ncbi:hypothetical protein PUNSTDRAFT_61807 [Punctularia strigosozonata HHB-11173 SS5]|uniref:uncharacterized protein n=1 Tax=Punctularia strigosozonata (strain HHB-11173) TaxID=741275 RepID=UPI00044166B1|nr:uncharacterized protein PUNSTDRAFT_61807 [Punctularia strigosozonata HHB-11173 SS5]EIN11490.1 hypothetical protein PUNSTDRAFT_61807 [Punctularia strigosozonata HHB-11173 SS5]
MGLIHKYKVNISGTTSANTRSHAIRRSIARKIRLLVLKYRDAWRALLILSPDGKWKTFLHELHNDDVRGPYPEENESEGRREDSWIWRSRGHVVRQALMLDTSSGDCALNPDEELDETMLYMWAGARARALRWSEEVQLLAEEMRRVVAFLHWQADTWESKKGARSRTDAAIPCTPDTSRGADCYAFRQADLCRALAAAFVRRWKPLLFRAGLGQPWISRYSTTQSKTAIVPQVSPASQRTASSEDAELTPSAVAAGKQRDVNVAEKEDGPDAAEGQGEEEVQEDQDGEEHMENGEDGEEGEGDVATLDAMDYSMYLTTD